MGKILLWHKCFCYYPTNVRLPRWSQRLGFWDDFEGFYVTNVPFFASLLPASVGSSLTSGWLHSSFSFWQQTQVKIIFSFSHSWVKVHVKVIRDWGRKQLACKKETSIQKEQAVENGQLHILRARLHQYIPDWLAQVFPRLYQSPPGHQNSSKLNTAGPEVPPHHLEILLQDVGTADRLESCQRVACKETNFTLGHCWVNIFHPPKRCPETLEIMPQPIYRTKRQPK